MRGFLTVGILSLLLASCIDDAKNETEFTPVGKNASGCLMGVVTDGLHADRIDISAAKIYMVTSSEVVSGMQTVRSLPGASVAGDSGLIGEYVLCGVPFGGASLPLYIELEGYQTYSALVTFPEKNPTRTQNDVTGYWTTPTLNVDVQLFKIKDLITNDFLITVTKAGVYVSGASVVLEPRDNATGNPLKRMASRSAQTNENGVASFASTSLAFGQRYALHVYDPTPSSVSGGTGTYGEISDTVYIGQIQTPGGVITSGSVFGIGIDLSLAVRSPKLITQTANGTISESGVVTLTFDREVVVDSFSIQSVTYSITNPGYKPPVAAGGFDACGAADIANPVAGTDPPVSVSIAGNKATITPAWTVAPAVGPCLGVTMEYNLSALKFYSKGGSPASPNAALGTVSIFLSTPAS